MFRAILNEKIGVTIRHFAIAVPHLSLTKLLKLLYITDETAVRETGVPITWLDYKVWQFGPVPSEIYQEIKHGERLIIGSHVVSLEPYISVVRQDSRKREGKEEVYIRPVGEDNLECLSEYELSLLTRIINSFGAMTAEQLVNYLHQEDSLWHKAVIEHNLKINFELFGHTSNRVIDFSDLIEGDEVLKMAAHAAYESLSFHKMLSENKVEENA